MGLSVETLNVKNLYHFTLMFYRLVYTTIVIKLFYIHYIFKKLVKDYRVNNFYFNLINSKKFSTNYLSTLTLSNLILFSFLEH